MFKDILTTLLQLFYIKNPSNTKGLKEHPYQKEIPLYILKQLKDANRQLKNIFYQIETLPNSKQKILFKIHSLCKQIIELVQICPASYQHFRPFFNGYLQSICEIINEYTFLSNKQMISESLEQRMSHFLQSFLQTHQYLLEILNQGLLLEMEELSQKIYHLNELMKNDINKKGNVIFLDDNLLKSIQDTLKKEKNNIQIL